MSSAHEVRAYAYVNRPYSRVSAALKVDAQGVFQRATSTAATRARSLVSTLRTSLGPVELGADVVVRIASADEEGDGPLGPRTRLLLSWQASQHPELFPTMDATLDVYSLGPEETQVDFHGTYRPPLGIVGAAIDAVIGHRVAEAAVHRFVEETAERLRVDVPA